MSTTYNFCYQHYTVYETDPDKGDWLDVGMYPPGSGDSPSAPREVWVAYLNYLRIVHPQEEYRLVETTISTTSEVLDV
jgi:hypothetical protein